MIKRVILLVVDGLGVGAAEDASSYGDAATHTLAHLAESAGGLSLPTLESLGLGHVTTIRGVRSMAQPVGCFGRLAFKSKGVDSLVGFWEIAGCLTEDEGRAFPEGYSSEAKAALEDVFGLKITRRPRRVRRGSVTGVGCVTSLGACAGCLDRRASDLSCGRP